MRRQKAAENTKTSGTLIQRVKIWLQQRWFTLAVVAFVLISMLVIRSITDIKRWWNSNPDRQLAEFVLHHDGTLVTDQSEKAIDDQAGVPFGRFNVRSIELPSRMLKDADIEVLTGRRDIEILNLSDNSLSDAAISTLGSLKSLNSLDLSRNHITAQAIARLQSKLPNATIAARPDDNFCKWALETRTARSVTVEVELSSRGTRGRRKCEELEKLPEQSLTVIEADFTDVSSFDDTASLHLQGLRSIEDLSLDGTGVSDESIEVLASLSSLRRLSLRSTSVSQEGVSELQEALPNAKIDH